MKQLVMFDFARRFFSLFLFAILFSTASAQTDTEFWFSAPEVSRHHKSSSWATNSDWNHYPAFFKITTGSLTSTVTISMPANAQFNRKKNGTYSNDTTFTIDANKTLIFDLAPFMSDGVVTPFSSMENVLQWTSSNTTITGGAKPYINRGNKGIHITATQLITVYYEIGATKNRDLLTLKGKNALGTQFYVPFQTHFPITSGYDYANDRKPFSSFDIVATSDNTQIEITPTEDVWVYSDAAIPKKNVINKGTKFIVWLDKGQTTIIAPYAANKALYQTSNSKTLCGSFVRVLNDKAVAIITRADLVYSSSTGDVDYVADQIVPITKIGKDYAIIRGGSDSDKEFAYVVGTTAGTTLTINGAPAGTVGRMGCVEVPILWDQPITTIQASEPIYVYHAAAAGVFPPNSNVGYGAGGGEAQLGGAIIPTISTCTGSSQVAFNRSNDVIDGSTYDFYMNIMVRKGAEAKFLLLENGIDVTASYPEINNPNNYKTVPYIKEGGVEQWLYAKFKMNKFAKSPVQYMLKNEEDVFHLALLNGFTDGDSFYGYFSDFNDFNPEAGYVAGSGLPNQAEVCYGSDVKLVARGGAKVVWEPTTFLDNPNILEPIALHVTKDMHYTATVSGACGNKEKVQVNVLVSQPVVPNFTVSSQRVCSDVKGSDVVLTFKNETVGGTHYFWDFNAHVAENFSDPGDGEINPTTPFAPFTHSFKVDPVKYVDHKVMLSVDLHGSCGKDTMTKVIRIYPPVKADFNVTPVGDCNPLTATFTNKSAGYIDGATYLWEFGDEGTSAAGGWTGDLMHTYENFNETAQIFEPKLTITDKWNVCRHDTTGPKITVQPYFKANFFVNQTEGCAPLPISVTNVSVKASNASVYKMEWDKDGDGVYETPDGLDWKTTFQNKTSLPIVVTLRLRITNIAKGCVDICERKITVNPEVTGAKQLLITYTGDKNCSPLAVAVEAKDISDKSGPYRTWLVDGVAIAENKNLVKASFTFENYTSASITKAIAFVATNDYGCQYKRDTTVTVEPFVKAQFVLDKKSGCSGEKGLTVKVTNTSSVGCSAYSWSLNNGAAIAGESIVVPAIVNSSSSTAPAAVPSAFKYPITLTAKNAAGCTDTYSQEVEVYPQPTVSFAYTDGGNANHCSPFSATFKADVTNANKYLWTFGDQGGTGDLSPSPFVFTNNTGIDSDEKVTLLVKNDFGCSATVSDVVKVRPQPVAYFTLDKQSACGAFDAKATALAVSGTPSYNWFYDGLPNGSTNDPWKTFAVVQNMTGGNASHSIHVEVSNGFCSATSMPRFVTSLAPITAEIISSDQANNALLLEKSCSPLKVHLTGVVKYPNGSVAPATTLWDLADGMNSKDLIPGNHEYINGGVEDSKFYDVKLNAKSKDGCEADASKKLEVYPRVEAAFNVKVEPDCHPMNILVTDASLVQSAGATYTWGKDGEGDIKGVKGESFHLLYSNAAPSNVALSKTITLDLKNSFGCVSKQASYTFSVDPEVKAAVFAPNDKVCAPGTLDFKNNSTGGDLNFLWDFGDGATLYASDSLPRSHHYENKGAATLTHTVTLTATNAKGCDNKATVPVSVYPAVQASFSADIEKACDPFTSKFINLTPSSAYKYSWTLTKNEAGATPVSLGSGQDAENSFSNKTNKPPVTETYTVKLDVETKENSACKTSASKTITVYPRVYPDFSMPDNGCHPFTTSFTNKTVAEGSGTTYLWTLGNGVSSTQTNPSSIKYINEGYTADKEYTVKLRATSGNGCVDSTSRKVTVHPVPKVEFKLDGPNAGCAPWPISATNTSVGTNLVYDFDYGVGAVVTNAGAGPYKRDYDNNGSDVASYILKLRGTTQYGCKDSLSQTVFAYPHVKANYAFNPGDKACNPFTVDMVNQSQNTHFYTWTFDDGQGSALDSPKHLFENKDIVDKVFNVKLRSESTYGCWDEVTKPLTVYAAPVADFQPVPPLQIYPNATFGLENKTFPAAPDWTYRWSLGDGQVRSGKDFNSYTYSKWAPKADGFRYEVILETASAHCKDSVHKFLTLLPAKPIAVFDSDTSAACSPLVVNFYNNSSYADNVLWDFGDGTTSTELEPRHTFTQPGYYNVKLSISGDGGIDNKYGTYRVFKNPVARFKVDPTTVLLPEADAHFFNTSENAVRYQWEFDDAGQTSTEKDPVYRFSGLGSYNVKLTVWTQSEEGSCVDDTTVTAAVRVIGQGTLKFPNAFTPDVSGSSGGAYDDVDTQNKVFHPVWEGVDSYVLKIFNRWGEQIFESHDVKVGWDGLYKGKISDPDVYVWKAEGRFTNGKTFTKMGDVTLIR